MELYLQMMLIDGLFHADPHPGNLLFSPDGKVVLLDFGMVVDVPREMRWHLVTTVFAAIRRDTDGIIAGFERMGFVEPGADMGKIRELADALMKLAYEKTTTKERIELLADQVMAVIYDFPILLPSEMVYFARTAALIEGLGTRYDPRFNAIMFASPIAVRMRARIMASLSDEAGRSPVDMATVVGAALGHVAGLAVKAGRELLGRWFAAPASESSSVAVAPTSPASTVVSLEQRRIAAGPPAPSTTPDKTLAAGD